MLLEDRASRLCHSAACSLAAPPCPACTFLHCPGTDPAKLCPHLSPPIPPGSCFPHSSGLQAEGGFLPRSASLTWAELGEKLRTPTTLMPTTAKNNKATDRMIQKVLEGAGKCAGALLSWEPGQKKEEQELKLILLPILHQTFPAHDTNPCANWLECRAAKPLQHLE